METVRISKTATQAFEWLGKMGIEVKPAIKSGEMYEFEYENMRQAIAQKLGSDDAYLEVFVEDMRYSDEPITAFISENIADIYQEVKDLACNYQTREEAVMNDALVSCLEAFEQHWGQKLLNVLRPLHTLSLHVDE